MNVCISDASVFSFKAQELILSKCGECISTSEFIPITPRGAGTSLGGQAIGEGVVLDFRNCNRILGFDPETRRVRAEPGVIQDALNDFLKPYGVRFAPDTSTSNRATIGGMIGNNSCGMYSCYWGTTREHVYRIKAQLSDGSVVWFGPLDAQQLAQKCALQNLEGHIYRTVLRLIAEHREAILSAYPDPSVTRRNTGYALDVLARDHQPFNPDGKLFSLVPLLCGSEGTLVIFLEAELETVPLPEKRDMLCAHFSSLNQAFLAVAPFMKQFSPAAVELLDHATLTAAKGNAEQAANRFWLLGEPEAVLAIELFDMSQAEVEYMQQWLKAQGAYDAPHLEGAQMQAVWALRKAGLGLLMGERTRKKAVAVVEDAAVPLRHLGAYYHDMRRWFEAHGVEAVFYGHASVGLIHIRPKLDLSQPEDKRLFEQVARFSAERVKRYRGALSGEHGDGRIRASFLRDFFGDEIYRLNVALKEAFDPDYRFNPGVIIGNMPITQNLRVDIQPQVEVDTGLDWSENLSLFDAVSQCNGAGACLKSTGRGVMCPSYQALREEFAVTRGRANLLREALVEKAPQKALQDPVLRQAMESCLACKACKTECPASVDMAALKSEWRYQTHRQHKLERWTLKLLPHAMKVARRWPAVADFIQQRFWLKYPLKLDTSARLPKLRPVHSVKNASPAPEVVVWLDFITQTYQNPAFEALEAVLRKLEISAIVKKGGDPLRLWLSNGMLDEARVSLQAMAAMLAEYRLPIIGLEPSEVLLCQDEAGKLGVTNMPEIQLAERWLAEHLSEEHFKPQRRTAWVHVHCHQKAARKQQETVRLLEKIPGLSVRLLNTGCCGMAGDYGYKYPEWSRKVAEVSFLPHLQQIAPEDWLIASGFSCQHQVQLLTSLKPLHPLEAVALALK